MLRATAPREPALGTLGLQKLIAMCAEPQKSEQTRQGNESQVLHGFVLQVDV